MKGSVLAIVLIIICVFAVLGMLGFIFFGSSNHLNTTTQQASVSLIPTIPVKDFAPNLPMSQKATILIQTSDSSDIKYIVPADQVNTYIKSLPEGYRVVSKTP